MFAALAANIGTIPVNGYTPPDQAISPATAARDKPVLP